MILPKNNQKSYGVLHTENYFSFIGFCKKVDSNEIQSVDIYLDDKLIDTILADKKLQKIEDIYDIQGFGFEYNLDEKYIGSKGIISFKNHITQENIQNSPYELIDKTNQNFDEYRFMHSLTDVFKIHNKNRIFKDSIGFMATEENLNNEKFINYVKELCVEFPEITFNAFYFNNKEKELLTNIFTNNINILKVICINELLNTISIFLCNYENSKDYLIFKSAQFIIYPLYINIKWLPQILPQSIIELINKRIIRIGLKKDLPSDLTGNDLYKFWIDTFFHESNVMKSKIINDT